MNTAKYQHSFFNLEKQTQSTIKKLVVDDNKTTDQTHILEYIKEFYETLFNKRGQKTTTEIKSFLSFISISKPSEDKAKLCEEACKMINLQVTMN